MKFPLYGSHEHIIGSVDSICRDSVDMQYKLWQRISQNLKSGKVRSLYNNVSFVFKCSLIPRPSVPHVLRVWGRDYFRCFMTYNTPSCTKGIANVPNQEVTNFFSFFFLFFFRRAQLAHHFFHLWTCTKHLQQNVIITQDCWIRNTVRRQHTLCMINSLNVLGVMNATALWPTLNLGAFMNYSEGWNWDYCHIMSDSQPRIPFCEEFTDC